MSWQDDPIVEAGAPQRPAWADDPIVSEAAAPQAPADTRRTGDLADAVLEPLTTMATGAIATPVAGVVGLGTIAGNVLGLTNRNASDMVERTQAALTYEPRTKAGALATRAASYPFEKLAQGADWVGQQVVNATDSPLAGTVVNTGTQVVPALLLKGRGKQPARPSPTPSSTPAAATSQAPAAPALKPSAAPEYIAPDLVLEQTQRAPAAAAKAVTNEVKAKEYAGSIGLDWNSLSRQVQTTLADVASDSRQLAKLDPEALKRQALLESLPAPVRATRGQVTRDPVQLRNETNISATEAGRPIREIYLDQNQAILDNLDILKGRVANKKNAAQTSEAVGISVQDQALRAKLQLKKDEVKAKYKAAEEAGELQGKVSPREVIKTIYASPDKTHYGWVQTWLTQMEVVQKTKQGTITRKLTLKEMEDLRQAAVARAMDGGTEGYYAGKVISAIDKATEGAGGSLYQQARKARKEQALEFEETGAIARLVENKSRTDRAVALEDTWRKSVIGGSVQDLRNIKRSLLTGGNAATRSAGRTAWRDMRAQTIQYIKDEATKGVALNERGQPNVTPAAMKRAIDSIGKEKLDELFGGGTKAYLDRLLEATRTVKTVPPAGHAGSSTMSNVLAFLEKGLGKIPVLGNAASGAVRAGVKLNEMGASGKVVREAQNLPLKQPEPPPPPREF